MSSLWLAGHDITQAEATIDYPRPDRLVNGNPKRTTHDLYQHPHMNCGIWECEIGMWEIHFAPNKQEFFQIIEGKVRIHDANTNTYIEVLAGEAGVIPPDFKGRFEVVETVKKYFVIVEST